MARASPGARASPRAGVAPSGSRCWGPQGSCLPLLWCQPVPGTAKGLVPLLELLHYHGVASTAQHSQQGTARRQSGSWGLQGDLQPAPHETMEKTPCFCPMTHLHQKEWLWGHHTCCHPIPHSSLPRAGTGTHHTLSALPASWQWLQHWPKECSTAGRVQDGQAG